jgi:hypothetical protein
MVKLFIKDVPLNAIRSGKIKITKQDEERFDNRVKDKKHLLSDPVRINPSNTLIHHLKLNLVNFFHTGKVLDSTEEEVKALTELAASASNSSNSPTDLREFTSSASIFPTYGNSAGLFIESISLLEETITENVQRLSHIQLRDPLRRVGRFSAYRMAFDYGEVLFTEPMVTMDSTKVTMDSTNVTMNGANSLGVALDVVDDQPAQKDKRDSYSAALLKEAAVINKVIRQDLSILNGSGDLLNYLRKQTYLVTSRSTNCFQWYLIVKKYIIMKTL